jgi:tagatose-6-phosphate ketose/aldose isomerase
MNAFERLLALPEREKRERGAVDTPREIAQQPEAWRKVAALLEERGEELRRFAASSGMTGEEQAVVVLAGAGSSEFIGNAIAPVLRARLAREVLSIPTTHLVTHGRRLLVPGHPTVLLSFARSGNSPESLASCRLAAQTVPRLRQLVITCNPSGELAKLGRQEAGALCLLMPPETDDRSLAMTSSFSAMALAGIGLGYLDALTELREQVRRASLAGERIVHAYGDLLDGVAALPFSRACYLGSGALHGTAQECSLKMQEMSSGRVAAQFNSYLGLRHGPQVFIDADCLVAAALSSDPTVRRYELDLLRELKAKRQGLATLLICDRAGEELGGLGTHLLELFPEGEAVGDDFRVLTDVMVGQMLATFKSLRLGLSPDDPSPSGTIHRVVQGVRIYEG